MAKDTRKASGAEYKIQDAEALSSVLQEAITERYGGNRDAAAKSVAIPHSTLKRYHEGRGGAVRRETLLKLRRLVGANRRNRLSDAVLAPPARMALGNYDDWLREEILGIRFGTLRGTHVDMAFGEMKGAEDHANTWEFDIATQQAEARGERLEHILSTLRGRYPGEWRPLERHLEGHDGPRARLAFLRVVSPLLASEDTAEIERSWKELTHEELSAFIKAGVTREKILLDRETDVARAQAYAKRARRSFLDLAEAGADLSEPSTKNVRPRVHGVAGSTATGMGGKARLRERSMKKSGGKE